MAAGGFFRPRVATAVHRRPVARSHLLGDALIVADAVWPTVALLGDALRLYSGGSEIPHLSAVGTIPGVAIRLVGARNGPGTGQIRSHGTDGRTLSWRAPGSDTHGTDVTITGKIQTVLLRDGEDPDKWVRCQVYRDYLSATGLAKSVYLADVYNNAIGHDNTEALDSDVYTITLKNEGEATLVDLRCWIDADWAMYLDISKNGSAYYSPTSEDDANVLIWSSLAPDATTTLYIQRDLTAVLPGYSSASVLTFLHFAWSA